MKSYFGLKKTLHVATFCMTWDSRNPSQKNLGDTKKERLFCGKNWIHYSKMCGIIIAKLMIVTTISKYGWSTIVAKNAK